MPEFGEATISVEGDMDREVTEGQREAFRELLATAEVIRVRAERLLAQDYRRRQDVYREIFEPYQWPKHTPELVADSDIWLLLEDFSIYIPSDADAPERLLLGWNAMYDPEHGAGVSLLASGELIVTR